MFRFPELLLLCSFIITLLCDHLAYADPPYKLCSNSSFYSDNSTFAENLNTLLNSLPSNASVSKLYNTSFGNEPDKVFAIYMCLNYLDLSSCHGCINMAQQDIANICPNSKEAVVWEDDCQLRYSNQNFFGRLNVDDNIPLANTKNISAPENFETVVNKTLSELAKQAAFNQSLNMYATGEVAFQDKIVYALVQCTTDLSGDECDLCLDRAIEDVLKAFYFSIGARLLSRSCYLRYELYAFYEGAKFESPIPNNKGGGRKIWWITTLTILSACLGILVVSYVCLAMRKSKKRGNREILGQHDLFYKENDTKAQEYPNISLASIHAATNKFSDSNKLLVQFTRVY
ncbi:hypothetical protein ACLB2K_033188 [Fragaria x ananassa]